MRARNIKPAFFIDSKTGKLSSDEKVLFIGLWCLADRDGFFRCDHEEIKAQIFPYDNKANIQKLLCNLMSLHLITFNDTSGYIPKFSKHQRPHPHEAKSDLSDESKNILKNLCNKMSCNVRQCKPDIMNDDIRNEERGMRIPSSPTPTGVGSAPFDLPGLWIEKTKDVLPTIRAITKGRKSKILARLKETPKDHIPETYWSMVIDKILASEFCCGNGSSGWKADFDWLLKPDTHIKVSEGKYDNKSNGSQLNQTQRAILESEARDRERGKENEHQKELT